MTMPKRQKAYRFGVVAESVTCGYLRLKGYRILARRYKTKVGEVDIVALKSKSLVFTEVKARHGSTAEVLQPRQQRRIERAAMLFIAKHPQFATLPVRFDVVLWRWPVGLKHIPSAWRSQN